MDYWVSGELPTQYRNRRPHKKIRLPDPLPEVEQKKNRGLLLDYLQLELQLLESQLDLGEETAAMKQLSRRYPMDTQGRLIYPLVFPLSKDHDGNPFFLPQSVLQNLQKEAAENQRLASAADVDKAYKTTRTPQGTPQGTPKGAVTPASNARKMGPAGHFTSVSRQVPSDLLIKQVLQESRLKQRERTSMQHLQTKPREYDPKFLKNQQRRTSLGNPNRLNHKQKNPNTQPNNRGGSPRENRGQSQGASKAHSGGQKSKV